MAKKNIRDYKQVSGVIRAYYENPESIMSEVANS